MVKRADEPWVTPSLRPRELEREEELAAAALLYYAMQTRSPLLGITDCRIHLAREWWKWAVRLGKVRIPRRGKQIPFGPAF